MHGSRGTGDVERRGYERQGGRPAWRPALHGGTAVVCPLSGALQQAGEEILGDNGEQMDVHMGCTHHPAVHHATRGKHRLRQRAGEDIVGIGIRGSFRNVSRIHPHDDRTEHAAPYGGGSVQLCAACRVGDGQHTDRHGCDDAAEGHRHIARMSGCVARDKEQVETRHGKRKER